MNLFFLFECSAFHKTHQTARREHCLKSVCVRSGGFHPLEMSYFVVEQVNTHIPHKDLPVRGAIYKYIYSKVEHERRVINALTSVCTEAGR